MSRMFAKFILPILCAEAEAQASAGAAEAPAKIKFCEKTSEGSVITFKFGNGTVRVWDLDTLPEQTQADLMVHGGLQKGGDSYAGAAGDYGYAIEQLDKVWNNLSSGMFNASRTGTGGPKTGELAAAIAKLQGMELADAQGIVDALDDATKKAVRANPEVKACIAEMRAAAAAEAAKKAREAAGASSTPFDLSSLKKAA